MNPSHERRRLAAISHRVTSRYLEAQETVTLTALVKGRGLVAASDNLQATSPSYWRQYTPPYDLYILKGVPLDVAEKLVDHGERAGFSYPSDEEAWRAALPFAARRPIVSVDG